METSLLVTVLVGTLAGLGFSALVWRRLSAASQVDVKAEVAGALERLDTTLGQKISVSTADMATRLEATKGELREQVKDRIQQGFSEIRGAVEQQLKEGREEQNRSLADGRRELTGSLLVTTQQLKAEFQAMNQQTAQSLDGIRDRVDAKLAAITEQVQVKLDQNIKEGFAQFEKVQQHLRAAEEQLKEVSTLGHSINDLNNLLKLPHLRGQFGEESLERLLADFLPLNMYELQASPGEGGGRVDAVINFPERKLPIDAKFPREQVSALFGSNEEEEIEKARGDLLRVMKAEGKRIQQYIRPESGTTDIALMYLPSETLYMEVIRNREIGEALNALRVFPVSPNTLMMTLQTIALVHKWYEVAKGFEKSRTELGKAQKSFDHFQNQFENVGKSLGKAQEAFDKATTHLKTYRGKVTALSGQEQLGLDTPAESTVPDVLSDVSSKQIPLIDKASA
ncbi:MAG TPA: DNA recombination protein RmuC [Terriglobales bacterium]|nr:DNA recombination protein RmuC [Terriglobales bacterium]